MKKNISDTPAVENTCISVFREKKKALKKFISEDPYLADSVENYKKGTLFRKTAAFVSVCDGTARARVFRGTGDDISQACDAAFRSAEGYVLENALSPLWLKLDLVNSCKIVTYKSFCEQIKKCRDYYFKKGVSFDVDFSAALLEAELNCAALINYGKHALDLDRLREYFAENDRGEFSAVNHTVIEFTTIGYICDENKALHKLYPDDENYGRRVVSRLTKDDIYGVIQKSSEYLSRCVQSDGRFDYGVNPTCGQHFTSYNIVRHTGTIWSLIMQYETTGDKTVATKVKKALAFMLTQIEQPDEEHAYLIEKKADEIKLGGIAVAVITLCAYIKTFNAEKKYKKLVCSLANSILDCAEQDGSFYHVLSYPDYKRKERDRIVYYDGEAAFALAKAYGLTGEKKYLDCAKRALDYFIANNYTRFCDHWIAYAVNEITLYDSRPEYLDFGLRNAGENLSKIFGQDTTYHTFEELLMAAFELYERIRAKKLPCPYLSRFNADNFIKTIYRRAHYMLNGYLYPELAMYMKEPLSVAYTFCVRHDSYRIRIDDVQHYIGGYYSFYRNFDKLERYYNAIEAKPAAPAAPKVTADSERISFLNWILKNV